MGWNRVAPSESLSSETVLAGWISAESECEAAGMGATAPEVELRLEKLA